ncbi:MAG: TRIC cation channel family protein [Candidatus Dactylopiibacterium sp.]|nr:TRIC cation channel family protein [Candidatus Dactylopiibacterium sp.]
METPAALHANLLHWITLAGVALYALTGVLDAGRKGMDLVGACAVGLATAAGGGTLRDVLLDRQVFWIGDQSYMLVALGTSVASFFLCRLRTLPARLFLVPDALALALFAVSGTQIALAVGAPALIAWLMGIVTGVAGGVIRDILCNDIPLIFLPGELYAIAAAGGAGTTAAMTAAGFSPATCAIAGFAAGAALRFAAMAFRLRGPQWRPPEGQG